MDKVNVTINGIQVSVPKDYTVLLAAREAGIDIPTLCYLKDVNEIAACRVCVVEADINGVPMKNLPASCVLQVADGMNVRTNTAKVRKACLLYTSSPQTKAPAPSLMSISKQKSVPKTFWPKTPISLACAMAIFSL